MRLRAALVSCEVALALAVLVGAGLLVRTSRNISLADVGFEPRGLLTLQIGLDARLAMAALLAGVAAVAAFVPALRAMSIDPMLALHHD